MNISNNTSKLVGQEAKISGDKMPLKKTGLRIKTNIKAGNMRSQHISSESPGETLPAINGNGVVYGP